MSLTPAQQKAVAARGNVLVMAGAGTGKTSTLVARCLDCLGGSDPASLDELLVVTFVQDYRSSNLSNRTVKRQYWSREKGLWRVVFETVV